MGLRTQSIKTGKKLSIFSKELMFVVAKTTFVFEEKEEEVLQKKMKSTTKSKAQAFFPARQFPTSKTNSINCFGRKWQKKSVH